MRRLLATLTLGLMLATAGGVAGGEKLLERLLGTLEERLESTGRAQVRIERIAVDPVTGQMNAASGILVLEPPDRAALEFRETGERITVRSDGGEWLQPSMRQMVRMSASQAAAAQRWWAMLVRGGDGRFTARKLAERRYVIATRGTSREPADSAWIALGADGLPVRLELDEGAPQRTLYRLQGWRFGPPKGRPAFVLRAPTGYDVVDLP